MWRQGDCRGQTAGHLAERSHLDAATGVKHGVADGANLTGGACLADAKVGNHCRPLSGGQQKLVALGRALMPGRKLILLDEPFEGVAPVLAQRLSSVIADLRGEGLTVLIAESDDTHSADLVDSTWRIERGSVSAGREHTPVSVD